MAFGVEQELSLGLLLTILVIFMFALVVFPNLGATGQAFTSEKSPESFFDEIARFPSQLVTIPAQAAALVVTRVSDTIGYAQSFFPTPIPSSQPSASPSPSPSPAVRS